MQSWVYPLVLRSYIKDFNNCHFWNFTPSKAFCSVSPTCHQGGKKRGNSDNQLGSKWEFNSSYVLFLIYWALGYIKLLLSLLFPLFYSYYFMVCMGLPWWLSGKESTCQCRRQGLEKKMATHSSILAWKIPWTEEPGSLQSMGSLRVGHDWVTSVSHFTFLHWSRKWRPTPVFLPGESQGWGSLVSCRLWGSTELDKTEAT